MVAHVAGQAPGTASPPLVGREREQTTLRAALAAALSGRGSLALIGGEAGIGKTTIAEALCAEGNKVVIAAPPLPRCKAPITTDRIAAPITI